MFKVYECNGPAKIQVAEAGSREMAVLRGMGEIWRWGLNPDTVLVLGDKIVVGAGGVMFSSYICIEEVQEPAPALVSFELAGHWHHGAEVVKLGEGEGAEHTVLWKGVEYKTFWLVPCC